MRLLLAATVALLPVTAVAQSTPITCGKLADCMGTTTFPPSAAFQPAPAATSITFGSGISVNTQTGEVHIPKGLPLDKAAREFWNMVATVAATKRPFPGDEP